ncbi:DUF1932 domain-containing protein [Streptomyces sp. NPDC047968]|uniref:NAD(P)-dependent oxidoreductase n=1 Tax=unclassified Streptomyces TaxID=2593676 RepID=UPI00341990C0
MTTITLLNPGSMGAPLASHAVSAGHRVLWVSRGRSTSTQQRAHQAGLTTCDSLEGALAESQMVLSICPPHAAEDVAIAVSRHRFTGTYVDANAISPQRMRRISEHLPAECTVLDGCIVGPPPARGRTARLYLSGLSEASSTVEKLFSGSDVHVRRAGEEIGAASALKMAFASYQKAARTLAGVAHALAHHHGVADLLTEEAATMPANILSDPGYLPSVAARAWRWAPEMREVADTLRGADLPDDIASATAEVMKLWERDKDRADLPLHEALAHLYTGDEAAN